MEAFAAFPPSRVVRTPEGEWCLHYATTAARDTAQGKMRGSTLLGVPLQFHAATVVHQRSPRSATPLPSPRPSPKLVGCMPSSALGPNGRMPARVDALPEQRRLPGKMPYAHDSDESNDQVPSFSDSSSDEDDAPPLPPASLEGMARELLTAELRELLLRQVEMAIVQPTIAQTIVAWQADAVARQATQAAVMAQRSAEAAAAAATAAASMRSGRSALRWQDLNEVILAPKQRTSMAMQPKPHVKLVHSRASGKEEDEERRDASGEDGESDESEDEDPHRADRKRKLEPKPRSSGLERGRADARRRRSSESNEAESDGGSESSVVSASSAASVRPVVPVIVPTTETGPPGRKRKRRLAPVVNREELSPSDDDDEPAAQSTLEDPGLPGINETTAMDRTLKDGITTVTAVDLTEQASATLSEAILDPSVLAPSANGEATGIPPSTGPIMPVAKKARVNKPKPKKQVPGAPDGSGAAQSIATGVSAHGQVRGNWIPLLCMAYLFLVIAVYCSVLGNSTVPCRSWTWTSHRSSLLSPMLRVKLAGLPSSLQRQFRCPSPSSFPKTWRPFARP